MDAAQVDPFGTFETDCHCALLNRLIDAGGLHVLDRCQYNN